MGGIKNLSFNIMNHKELVERIYDHIENDNVSRAVMGCLRLSRLSKDYINSTIFLRELHPDKTQLWELFYLETKELNDETKDIIWKLTTERWIDIRTIKHFKISDDDEKNVVVLGVGEIENEIDQMKKSITDLTLPKGMGEFDTAAFTDRYNEQKVYISFCQR